MKKFVKATLLVLGGTAVGAVAGNLLGRTGLETPVIVAVILSLFASLHGYKLRNSEKKYITQQ